MFRIIQNTFLIGWIGPRNDTPVAPLGLEGIGIPMYYTPAAPLGLCKLVNMVRQPTCCRNKKKPRI